jgi:hypothetical protein
MRTVSSTVSPPTPIQSRLLCASQNYARPVLYSLIQICSNSAGRKRAKRKISPRRWSGWLSRRVPAPKN